MDAICHLPTQGFQAMMRPDVHIRLGLLASLCSSDMLHGGCIHLVMEPTHVVPAMIVATLADP